ncbi:SFRS protein kinase [Pseudohyphozyma bogoriensis]|nr:SFRS protein kinase [Pseudohyphozyma bogoriensis]
MAHQSTSGNSAAAPLPIGHQHPSDAHAHTGGHQASIGSTSHLQPTSATSATSASFESDFTDEEKLSDYEQGGYHPIRIGEVYGPNERYVIVRKLGWGHFSTVWMNRHVALKVVKSATHYTETALDEIKLLQRVVESNPDHPGRRHVVSLLDHFTHRGPNGSHVCMVFEVLGENLLGLIKRYHHRGVPEHICKQIAKQVLLGLDYMHRECGIIHTDLKPENVLICIDDVEAVVRAELETSPAAVPTKLVGVPPSQGRGGTQTPRAEMAFITGSQPLPSPSSSYGTSPVIEKLAFQMSKISDSGSVLSSSLRHPATTADSVGEELGGVKLADNNIGVKSTVAPNAPKGPSLLSQQAPAPPPPVTNSEYFPPTPASGGEDVTMLSTSSEQSKSGDEKPSPPDAMPHNPLQPAPAAGDPTVLPPPAPYDPSTLERITVKIADLGNASWTDLHFTNDIQTRQYRSPEAILGAKWGTSVDMWSASAMFFELLTGDYLFDPHPGTRYNKDDDHIAQIIELMGPFPRSIALSGKFSSDIFTRKGELKHIHKLKFWPLHSVLQDKYLIAEQEAKKLEAFLTPMLNLNPDKRASAQEMLPHTWLRGVIVQGEIEVHLAKEAKEEEARKRRAQAASGQGLEASTSTSSTPSKPAPAYSTSSAPPPPYHVATAESAQDGEDLDELLELYTADEVLLDERSRMMHVEMQMRLWVAEREVEAKKNAQEVDARMDVGLRSMGF